MSVEIFNHIFNENALGYYKNRFSVGVEYKLAKRHTFEAGYKLNNEIDSSSKYRSNIFKLGYTFSF
jgi:outer membrane autotransporter protein